MKSIRVWTCLVAGTVLAIALVVSSASGGDKEQKIDLRDVPEAVIAAARAEVRGIELDEVDLIKKMQYQVYEFDGRVGRKLYEVQVAVDADGKILKVKSQEEKED